MGKGVIIEHEGDGFYAVDVYYNQTRIEWLINKANDKIVKLANETIPELQAIHDEKGDMIICAIKGYITL